MGIEADKLGLSPDDLVLVTTTVNFDSPPDYSIEKIVGNPVTWILNRDSLYIQLVKREKNEEI